MPRTVCHRCELQLNSGCAVVVTVAQRGLYEAWLERTRAAPVADLPMQPAMFTSAAQGIAFNALFPSHVGGDASTPVRQLAVILAPVLLRRLQSHRWVATLSCTLIARSARRLHT